MLPSHVGKPRLFPPHFFPRSNNVTGRLAQSGHSPEDIGQPPSLFRRNRREKNKTKQNRHAISRADCTSIRQPQCPSLPCPVHPYSAPKDTGVPHQIQHQHIPRPLRRPSSSGPATSRITNTPPPARAIFLHDSLSNRNKQEDAGCVLPPRWRRAASSPSSTS